MENIYSRNGLQTVINASGRMTKLGVSTISDSVGTTMMEAAGSYVVIDDLLEYVGKAIGDLVGTEDACATSSASAGVALSVASLICGDNLQKVQHFFETLLSTEKREVILLKGHSVDFGAPIAEMIELGGGKIMEVGFANCSKLEDIEHAVNERTLAIFYVKSHHCVQKDMVDVVSVIHLANRLQIPCIVDAAAEEDLGVYSKEGASYVCYSGAKAIEGPTSGFVACRTHALAANMRLQYKGIGRAMKIGKECMMGLVKAMEEYLEGGRCPVVTREDLEIFSGKVNEIPGCNTSIIQDEAGREIYRCNIQFHAKEFGMDAKAVVKRLQEGNVAVFTRDYQANVGLVAIDPRPLNSKEELQIIYDRIKGLSLGGK